MPADLDASIRLTDGREGIGSSLKAAARVKKRK
jgi:hypothetical protein